jgi:hypothetical protein
MFGSLRERRPVDKPSVFSFCWRNVMVPPEPPCAGAYHSNANRAEGSISFGFFAAVPKAIVSREAVLPPGEHDLITAPENRAALLHECLAPSLSYAKAGRDW